MSSNDNNENLPYVLQPNGCRYYVDDVEKDRGAGITHDIICAACSKDIIFVNGYNRLSADVAPHFKHHSGDLKDCPGYDKLHQLQTSTYCLDSLKKNAKNENKKFELICESFNCFEIVAPPYVIAFQEANVEYRTAFINASNNAIQDKTFRIKANMNCPFFNNTRCNLCETTAAAAAAAIAAAVFAAAAKKGNKENGTTQRVIVLECELCVAVVPPRYVIDFEGNDTYWDALNDAINSASENDTFRIKASTNYPLFNKSLCQMCENATCAQNLAVPLLLHTKKD